MASTYIEYDASVIQEFAQRLYRRAASVVVSSTALGGIGGAVVGIGACLLLKSEDKLTLGFAIGGLVGGVFGFLRGQEHAFRLKLQAQTALCQAQIEHNTRARDA
jgi:hypothetical protein